MPSSGVDFTSSRGLPAGARQLRLVGTADVKQALSGFTDTGSLPFFDSIPAARAAS